MWSWKTAGALPRQMQGAGEFVCNHSQPSSQLPEYCQPRLAAWKIDDLEICFLTNWHDKNGLGQDLEFQVHVSDSSDDA